MEEIITPGKEPSVSKKQGGMNWIVVIIILILLGAALWWYLGKNGNLSGGGEQSAAVVNGFVITTDEFNERLERTRTNLEFQGVDLSQEGVAKQLQRQVVDELVNERLVLQDAEKKGIVVDDAAYNQALDAIKTRFSNEEEFKQELAKGKLSEDEWKESVRRELVVQKYIEASIQGKDVAASDAEVKTFYDDYVKQQPEDAEVPKLADIQDQIKTQLESQKIAAVMQQILADLKAAAQIEISENLK